MIKGFKSNCFNDDHLEMACLFGSYDYKKVHFVEFGEMNPLEALNTLGDIDTNKFSLGQGKSLDQQQLCELLSQINSSDSDNFDYWQDFINIYNKDGHYPIIFINNKLCDGSHRCLMQYILGEKVPIAYFKENK